MFPVDFRRAPPFERLRENRALAAALSAVTAAVVGVILNLALWFALHYWFGVVDEVRLQPLALHVPDPASVDWFAVLLSLMALFAMIRFRLGTFAILALCSCVGLARIIV